MLFRSAPHAHTHTHRHAHTHTHTHTHRERHTRGLLHITRQPSAHRPTPLPRPGPLLLSLAWDVGGVVARGSTPGFAEVARARASILADRRLSEPGPLLPPRPDLPTALLAWCSRQYLPAPVLIPNVLRSSADAPSQTTRLSACLLIRLAPPPTSSPTPSPRASPPSSTSSIRSAWCISKSDTVASGLIARLDPRRSPSAQVWTIR